MAEDKDDLSSGKLTADNLRDLGGAKWVQNVKHQGGNRGRRDWEDGVDARFEKVGYIAGIIAKKFANEGMITINEDGKTFHIGGDEGGEVYQIKMLPLVWASLKKKK